MKFHRTLLASAALVTAFGANAAVTGAAIDTSGSFVSLSSAGLDGGAVATLSGGSIYTADESFADIPKGGLFGGNFLAVGVRAGQPATLSFLNGGVGYVSFLWGSPDSYNRLTVNSTGSSQMFDTSLLGLPGNGDQSISRYVAFTANAGDMITSLTFTNTPANDAFETANYSVTAPVPEPETYALLLGGLGVLGFVARRRKSA